MIYSLRQISILVIGIVEVHVELGRVTFQETRPVRTCSTMGSLPIDGQVQFATSVAWLFIFSLLAQHFFSP